MSRARIHMDCFTRVPDSPRCMVGDDKACPMNPARPRCRYVTGSTRDHPRMAEGGEIRHWGNELPDGRWEWLCGFTASYRVIGVKGDEGCVVHACDRDLHAVIDQLDDPVIVTRINLEGK